MKIKNLAKIVLMTTFFIILGTKVYATTGTINEKTVKLRKEPDSKTVLDYLYKGDEVEILEEEKSWYKVKAKTELGKVTGYISKEEVDTSSKIEENVQKEPVKEKVETPETISTDLTTESPKVITIEEGNEYTINEVSVKILPLINSREIDKISGKIEVAEIINNWAKIENDTNCGWIRKNILKESLTQIENVQQEQPEEQPEEKPEEQLQEKPEEKPEEQLQEQPEEKPEEKTQEKPTETKPEESKKPESVEINKTGYVSADGLKVRKGPSTDAEEITSFSKNHKVNIIGQTGKWYKIDFDGEIGYISAKYISDTKIAETTSRSGNTLKNEEIEKKEEIKEKQPQQEESSNVEETPVIESSSEPATSEIKGTEVVEYAKKYLGYKYVSGGTSPSKGFDCSGFTSYVYKHFGISLNRTSKAQIKNGVAVEKSDLQLGDIVLFNNDANTSIGHVGIYVGNGNFIHASNPSDGVKITTLTTGYYKTRYVGARRVI